MTTEQHPYVEQEAKAKAKLVEAKSGWEAARKRVKDFEIPWNKNTDARLFAEQSLSDAKASTPLEQVAQWQATVQAALFLDARFRLEYEPLLQAVGDAERNHKNARLDYEEVMGQIQMWRNDQADLKNARLEASIEAEVRTTRERLRKEAKAA